MKTRSEIKRWMRAHGAEHVDAVTGELDATGLVEAWDRAEAGGEATLDPDHEAWEVAVELAPALEAAARGGR